VAQIYPCPLLNQGGKKIDVVLATPVSNVLHTWKLVGFEVRK